MAEATLNMQTARRVLAIIISTLSMYILTHMLVLFLMPIAFFVAAGGVRKAINGFKKFFAHAVFWVIQKEVAVVGLDKIREGRKYLIVCNYPSGYVTFALMKCFPDISFVADEFISKIPIVGFFLKNTGTIFVDQKRPRRAKMAFDKALSASCRTVQHLLIYPEGRRSVDGRVGEFKYGFKYILRHSSYDLLPVTANGFYQLKPVRRIYLDPSAKLEIIFHEPIANSDARKMHGQVLVTRIERTIRTNYRP